MSVEISGITILEPHLASNESRDDPGVSKIFVGGEELVLVYWEDGPEGVTRRYESKSKIDARRRLALDGHRGTVEEAQDW